MTATAGTFAHDTFASDPSDPNAIFCNSPPMRAYRPRLEPSPSPPPDIPLPRVSSPPASGRKTSNKKRKVPPSQGDAVLVHYLDGGRRPELAIFAGEQPLDGGYVEEDDDDIDDDDDDDDESHSSAMSGYIGSPKLSPGPRPANRLVDLKSLAGLAGGALAALAMQPPGELQKVLTSPESGSGEEVRSPLETVRSQEQRISAQPPPPPQPPQPPPHPQLQPLQPREPPQKPGLAMPITPYTPSGGHPDFYSPRSSTSGLRHPDMLSPGIPTPSSHGELPPITGSPRSETNGHTSQPSLPSIGDLLTEHHHNEKDNAWPRRPSYPHSPPGVQRIPMMSGLHSPTSPGNPYQSMPSPAQSMYSHSSSYAPYANGNGNGYSRPPPEFNGGGSHHVETPGAEQSLFPTPVSQDRMSIDHLTNSQIGQFVCKTGGCTAAPFQTQYLLNSHANVHSSARPHYCPMKGCPRSEGGKGFKRKNEMIRHGLVHESPGYVCPFCPDREHKYPRPDNLQRHVRVHHIDKDKDDQKLREVLAQRPDGPSRGRRRRGVP